ncbi:MULTISPECIES: hypothetical protein [Caulobacter]|jgi:hypothetical protein|uniref:hypothetical protein n=1 Tax=Caulobacter TaxID=75 RepID=UPI00054EBAC7|nr:MULTISPECIES: hypothetical protein [Caulobacter]MBQ1562536.1 hypothetical protein [Caulobacter sp.]
MDHRALIEMASPIELAALWRLKFMTGDDVAAACLLWLEKDLDRGDPNIAAFAGETGLVVDEIAPAFERSLVNLIGRSVERDEAILVSLRLHLAAALQADLMKGVQLVLYRFQGLTDQRLVHHPRRSTDRPEGTYAEQELGLEYVYGGFYAFDDIQHLTPDEQEVAKVELRHYLQNAVSELERHLALTI